MDPHSVHERFHVIPSRTPPAPSIAPHLDHPFLACAFVIPLVLLLLLRHPRVVSSVRSAPLLRCGILPISLFLTIRTPVVHRYEPFEDSENNVALQAFLCSLAVLRALEWTLAPSYDVYHRVPVESHSNASKRNGTDSAKTPGPKSTAPEVDSKLAPPSNRATGASEKQRLPELDHGPLDILLWCFEQLINFRGIGFSWGPPSSRLASPHRNILGLFKHIFAVHVLCILGAAIAADARDDSVDPTPFRQAYDPSAALARFSGLTTPAPWLHWPVDLAFTGVIGVVGMANLDLSVSFITLLACPIQSTLHLLVPTRFDVFDWRRWPPAFNDIHRATSVGDLWGRRWHLNFHRAFDVCGYRPARAVARSTGFGKQAQRAAGVITVFFISGMLHEYLQWTLAGSPPSPFSIGFPFTLLFFLSQPLAIWFLDPLIDRLLPSYGRFSFLRPLYVWIWLFATARPLCRNYLGQHLVTQMPPLERWSWQRWVVPMAVFAPRDQLVR